METTTSDKYSTIGAGPSEDAHDASLSKKWKSTPTIMTTTKRRNSTSAPSSTGSTGFQKFIVSFTGFLEAFFYRFGYTVAKFPYQSITASLLFALICSMGLMNFTYEDRPDKLLISQTSQLAYDTDWLRNNFPSPVRFSVAMFTAENVLTPNVFSKIMDIQERVEKITVKERGWTDICFKLPITKGIPVKGGSHPHNVRRRRNLDSFEEAFDEDFFHTGYNTTDDSETVGNFTDDPFYDAMLTIPDDIYCSFVESLQEACWQISPLELWGFNRTLTDSLKQEEIIHRINHEKISPIFGRTMDYTFDLGGTIKKNDKGEIISAGAIMVFWAIAVNKTALRAGEAVKDDGTGELADFSSLGFEKKWLEVMEEIEAGTDKNEMHLYYVTGRSFGDVYKTTMYNDMKIVVLGYGVMFLYVAIMLGNMNMIEQRPYLSMAGIFCAVLAGLVTCGLCSTFGLPFGNVNKVLPFLLLGVGVDDMFVIMQCWKNLYPNVLTKNYKESIPHRIGMALKTAGASITVTSLTDAAAFAIGATTLLPGLKSFCIYAAVGIIAVFLFQVTFFVGWFAIDQQRLENRRNAFFPCKQYKAKDYVPNKWSQTSSSQIFFEKVLAKIILSKPGKVCVILITFIFLGVNINGNINLTQEFDAMNFLAHDSHIVKYIDAKKIYYPNSGFNGFIVGHNINWTASFEGFETFVKKMRHSDAIFLFDPWYEDFKKYSNRNFKTDIPHTPISQEKFQKYLGKFLFSRIGSKYRQYFKAEKELTCGQRASPIEISMMPFKFRRFRGRDEHIPRMNEVKALVKNADVKSQDNSKGRIFPWSAVFVPWETDEIITEELYRNVCLSLICVLITIFFLLFNIRVCIFSGICVIFTVVDVAGSMYYWGLSIDTISVIANVVAIGLCVDYAAHVGLAFLMSTGSKDVRATNALKDIGPAVLNGGFSTFLGIVFLANSETYALQAFFKVLTAVVFFGLFHGLIFLPVLLSLIGPEPYPTTLLLSKGKHGLHSLEERDSFKPNANNTELCPLSNTENEDVTGNNIIEKV